MCIFAHVPQVSATSEALVLGCLRKDRERRLSSAPVRKRPGNVVERRAKVVQTVTDDRGPTLRRLLSNDGAPRMADGVETMGTGTEVVPIDLLDRLISTPSQK